MDKLILVLYVDMGDTPEQNVNEVVKKIGNSLFTEDVISNLNATTFVIPTRSGGTRIECINPKYIVDNDIYREYRLKLDILNENLDYHIKQKNDGK